MEQQKHRYDLCIIGGAGHVGLPLGVAFANNGVRTVLLDINRDALNKIRSGTFPFKENNGDQALQNALRADMLAATDNEEVIQESKVALIVIGTPIDEYLSPRLGDMTRLVDHYINRFREDQMIVLRSTMYPGSTEKIQNYFHAKGKRVRLAFCPERIVQGNAFEELKTWPQIVSAFDERTLVEVANLFSKISTIDVVPVKPIEAELAKLFTNAWRYIRFAVANEFFMIADSHGLDYHRIHEAMCREYPRNKDLPRPGFAAGPCLFKDTMQLAAFTNNNFWIGHAAMLINEGLSNYLIMSLRQEFSHELRSKTLGILGMAFKAESDDSRSSLSYRLRKIAQLECKKVMCTDPYVIDPEFASLEETVTQSDIILLATPHEMYRTVDPRQYPHKKFVDVWNFWGIPR